MTADLDGKIALVTGGTSGIGRDTAVLFARAGTKVVVAGRREREGSETIDLIRAAGGDGLFVKTDVSKDSDRTININLKGVWLCLKYEIRQMLRQGGGGAIVNMSSILGMIGSAGVAAYSASKHGVIGLTK